MLPERAGESEAAVVWPCYEPAAVADLLDDVLQASIDGICIFDRDRRCTHWNTALERLTGVDASRAIGRTQADLFPDSDQQRPYSLTFSPAGSGAVIGVARKSEAGINEMLSLASHKLKTPLAAMQIHLGAQLRQLQRGLFDKDNLERSTSSAIEQAMRMADTINMLVDVSRIDSGRWKLDWSDFELSAVVRHAAQRLKHTASDNGCEVRIDVPDELPVRMDRVRMEEVLATLLANSFKHGAGKPVDIEVRPQGSQVQIVVADHGGGIAPDDLPQVFTRGPRTALGLWIAKEIVLAHRGSIDVTSSPGQGSRFTIVMPRLAA